MRKTYITRKNLIVLSLAFFYSILVLFTGLCIDKNHTITNPKNPIALLAKGLGFREISCSTTGFIALILVCIYIIVLCGAILIIRGYAINNGYKLYNKKIVLCFSLAIVVSILLSYGLGIIIQRPLNQANIGLMTQFIWNSLLLSFLVYLIVAIFTTGILMFIINFINIDKPFKFFNKTNLEIIEDTIVREENIVDDSFDNDEKVNLTAINTVYQKEQKSFELDSREKVFPALSRIDYKYNAYECPNIDSDDISLNELCKNFRNYLAKEEKLYFDLNNIRMFISGLATSHFIILEGLSGTGKSSLPRYFSKFINGNILFTPVQSTWRDRTNLVGYFNDFSRTYQETDFLLHLYEANYNKDKVHMFVLDEMNISRCEYYFADFISVLEYPKEEWKIKLMQLPHEFIPPYLLNDGYIQITQNSYFIGTANKDDSTFTISDKVYDRAITIEFNQRNNSFTVNEDVKTFNISISKLNELFNNAKNNPDYQMKDYDYEKLYKITDFIYQEFDISFGNRILNQIEELVPVFVASGGEKQDALDLLLSRKLISKLEGRFEDYVYDSLKRLLELFNKTYGDESFDRCKKIIKSIMKKL